MIEKDAAKCERFEAELGSVCLRGDGCEVAIIAEAGASRADIFIATTTEDEDNLVSCQVAKHKFEVPKTIARVNNPKNERIFKKLGIDCTVSVTDLILEHIEEEIPAHPLVRLLTRVEEKTEVVEIRIPENAETIGKPVENLHLPSDSVLALVIRNGQKPQVPTADTVVQAHDRIIALTSSDSEKALREVLTGS